MNERIKELRKTLGLSAEKFGQVLGLQKSAISKIELGRTTVTEQNINLILKTDWNGKYVNEEWLRNGAGDMFITVSKEAQFGEAIARLSEFPRTKEVITLLGTEASNEFLVELESLFDKLLIK